MPKPIQTAISRGWDTQSNQIAYCVRYYEDDDGFAVCDLRNPDNGTILDRVSVSAWAGPINAPADIWDDKIDPSKHPLVVFGMLPDVQGIAIVFGLAYPRQRYFKAGEATASSDAPTLRDTVIANGGSRVTLKEDGRVYITGVGTVAIVLQDGATLQVSEDGDDGERAALAGEAYLNDTALAERVNKLEEWASDLMIDTNTGTPVPTSIYSRPSSPVRFILAKLQSALLRLSKKSELL